VGGRVLRHRRAEHHRLTELHRARAVRLPRHLARLDDQRASRELLFDSLPFLFRFSSGGGRPGSGGPTAPAFPGYAHAECRTAMPVRSRQKRRIAARRVPCGVALGSALSGGARGPRSARGTARGPSAEVVEQPRRWPTIFSRPRREWWSLWCSRKWSVRWLMRAVSSATCTRAEPRSFSWSLVLLDDGFAIDRHERCLLKSLRCLKSSRSGVAGQR
jgi:hypothetical protein